MPKSSCPWLSLIIVAGCAGKEAVFVDLSAVQATLSPQKERTVVLGSKSTKGPSDGRFTLKGWEVPNSKKASGQVSVSDSPDSQNMRKRALRDLRAHLYRAYSKDVELNRAGKEAVLEELRRKEYAAAQEQHSALLSRASVRRGQILARASFLAGFPLSSVPPFIASPDDPAWRKRWAQEFARLSKELAELDAQFKSEASRLAAEASEGAYQRRADLEIEIVGQRNDAADKATIEAEKSLRADEAERPARLLRRHAISLDSIAEKSVAIRMPAKGLPSDAMSHAVLSESSQLDALQTELRVFLAARGYALAKSSNEGRNVTKEFLVWIQKHRLGP